MKLADTPYFEFSEPLEKRLADQRLNLKRQLAYQRSRVEDILRQLDSISDQCQIVKAGKKRKFRSSMDAALRSMEEALETINA